MASVTCWVIYTGSNKIVAKKIIDTPDTFDWAKPIMRYEDRKFLNLRCIEVYHPDGREYDVMYDDDHMLFHTPPIVNETATTYLKAIKRHIFGTIIIVRRTPIVDGSVTLLDMDLTPKEFRDLFERNVKERFKN